MKIIEMKNVSKEYIDGDVRVKALKNVNLDLYEGEFVALIGPSGCGKSTLLNLITNLYLPSTGEIYFKGINIKKINSDEWSNILRNEIGFVYQYYELIDCLNVYDNICLKTNDDKYIDMMLEKLDLVRHKHQKVSLLSGGQKQRVGVIRALANNPSLILADEPTGALDYDNSIALLSLLKEYSRNSLVLMVTHNEELAKSFVNKIIYLDHGEIKEIKELKERKENIKKKNKHFLVNTNKRLQYRYMWNSIKSLKYRFIFLILSGSIIFLFIAFLFTALNIASTYVDNQYMYTPLYSVFNLYTYQEKEEQIIKSPINKDVVRHIMKNHQDIIIRENIDDLINNYLYNEIIYEDKVINDIKVYTLPNKIENKVLIKGRKPSRINEIMINETFSKYLNLDLLLGRSIKVRETVTYKGKTYCQEVYKEIVGVSKDSLLNQNKEIYVNYDEYLTYLKTTTFDNEATYFNILYNYDYQIVVNNLDLVSNVINKLKQSPYYRSKDNIPNHSYHFTLSSNIAYEEKEMFSELIDVISLLVYFFIGLGLTIFTIFSSYVLSSFVLEKRKDYALFTQLGIKKKNIYQLIIKQSLMISLIMIILGSFLLFVTYFICLSLNFSFQINIPILPLFILIVIFIIECLISSILPINQLRKIEIGNILKSE